MAEQLLNFHIVSQHSVEITLICSHSFLTKISWKQRNYHVLISRNNFTFVRYETVCYLCFLLREINFIYCDAHSMETSQFFCYSDFTWNQSCWFRVSKSVISTHLEDVNLDFFYEFLHFLKAENDQKSLFKASKMAITEVLLLLNNPKWISRKIWWVTGNFCKGS